MKVLIAVVVTTLVTAGSSFGAAQRWLTARPGDVVVADRVVCSVSQGGIGCNVRGHAATTAVISPDAIAVYQGQRRVFLRLLGR